MSQRAPVSVCLIVRDEEASGIFESCLESIRPHVEEVVIVDTGSTDGTPAIAKRYADVFEVFTGCNGEDGRIIDFALARNRSFDLATKQWIMWMDSDDVIRGGENIKRLVEYAEREKGADKDWCYLFPYEYVYNEQGQCICLHYRERLLSRRAAMRWVNPVHEVMIPAPESLHRLGVAPVDDVVFEHWRQRSKKPQESGRNLRILKQLVEVEGSQDARQFYYLGLEYANVQDYANAEKWLAKYVSVSGWKDEKTMAALKLTEICYAQKKWQEGLDWAAKAMMTTPAWGEGYFALARGHYHLALIGPSAGDVRENWARCAEFAKTGLAKEPTRTMLFINPLERNLEVPVFLTMALSQLGDARGALKYADEAAKASPDDPNLTYNRKVFGRLVAREDVRASLEKLIETETIDVSARDGILAAIDGSGPGLVGGWPAFPLPEGYPANVEAKHFPIAKKTPHARAWGIPEATDIDDLPVVMSDGQVEAATLLVWKELMLHDEVLAAERFLADAPYRAKHTPLIVAALERTRRMMAWMNDPSFEQKVNTPEDPTIENGVPLPGLLTGALAERARLAIEPLYAKEKILDFGCFDGGIVNRWGLGGLDVTGVDLCEGSIALAKAKAEEFKTGAKFVCSKFNELPAEHAESYDVVTCCDTYEHVRDHVKDLIAPARRALRPDGRMIVVTPHGAWMRGVFKSWAHPWRWGPDEGRPWNTDLPHAHLVAPTVWTVAENFRKDGWWVKDSFVQLSGAVRDVDGQGNVVCEAYLEPPPAPAGGALDIVFACGDAWQAWNPKVHKETGLGGSETMVVEMAKRLALAGHRVRVYTSTGDTGEGIFDGVEYRQSGHLSNVGSCDVLVAWRNANLLELPIAAKLRLLWVHDIFASNATHASLLKADRILALSEWHRGFLLQYHNLADEHVRVTRNGIDLARFADLNSATDGVSIARNPHKAVYSSSPDRGLPVLLQCWPEIRARVPDAELHVFYGFFNWKSMAEARGDERSLQAIEQLMSSMKQLEPLGVVFHDKVSQSELATEFQSAGVWAHPTWFTETSCITAMEAQAAGLRIVTSALAALNETVGWQYGVLLEGDWLSPEYQKQFVNHVVEAMTCPEGEWGQTREKIKARAAADFGLDALAEEWVTMMREEIVTAHLHPLVSYKPRADFQRADAPVGEVAA